MDSFRPTYSRDRPGRRDMSPSPPREMYHFRGNDGRSNDNHVNSMRRRDQQRPDPRRRHRRPASREPPSRDTRPYQHAQHRNAGRPVQKISSRPLLRSNVNSAEEQIYRDPTAQAKFRNLDELTDSDEDVMDLSEGGEDGDAPTAKRARLDTVAEDSEKAVPKWSDPNPYTSLPPPSESTGKKTDFVKLIRKARVAPGTKNGNVAISTEDNFISFDPSSESESSIPSRAFTERVEDVLDTVSATFLGKRKRDEIPVARVVRRDLGDPAFQDGMIVREWRCIPDANAAPWQKPTHSGDNAGLALHKEIVDFYEWVKPQDYEVAVRADALTRLARDFNVIESGDLKAFGSNAAGLYLPTGDLDLVFNLHSHRGQLGAKMPPTTNKSLIRRFADSLRRRGIAESGSIQLILHAKVPIIKFVERISGLKVDLSFNNETGPQAIETFTKWKHAHPAMPVIVSIIKQFLMLRGLNDVATGGLGGFSIICLVTSVFQHLPLSVQPPNLGEVLVEFFNLYGNLLDRKTVAIRLDPPGYVDKKTYMPNLVVRDKQDRLTIIDPNRPENNISGGTHQIGTIFKCFSQAYDVLQARMALYEDSAAAGAPNGFLQGLIGGNFEAYYKQRTRMHFLHTGNHLQRELFLVPLMLSQSPTSDEPPVSASDTRDSVQENGKATQVSSALAQLSLAGKAGVRRAQWLKLARPDLAPKISESISLKRAIQLGGYKNDGELQAELDKKLAELTQAQPKAAPTAKRGS